MKRTRIELSNEAMFRLAIKSALVGATAVAAGNVFAQDTAKDKTQLDTVEVTGTRILAPGVVSASPVYSIEADEIKLLQTPEFEQIFRLLPISVPGDGANVNNGSAGTATVNLRGLGTQRTLIMIDGKRLTPYNYNGVIDTSMIPLSMIDRIDIITGGASAVYGSDAMAGAINIITKRDFQGVDTGYSFSTTGDKDGDTRSAFALMGGNFSEGRGNAIMSLNWSDRQGVLLGNRDLGKLGISTATGAGYAQFLAGQPPTPPPAGCEAPNAVAATASGSTTTMPTRVAIAGSKGIGQFRNDGTIGANCSKFNFNPYNYYQTPQERFGGTVAGHFDIAKDVEGYTRISYGETQVTQQVAPSGLFNEPFFTPLSNPLIGAAARTTIINAGNAGRTAGTLCSGSGCAFQNWHDKNGNNVVDAPDDLLIAYRRRTLELGPRSTNYANSNFQFVLGTTASIFDTYKLDVSYARGVSQRTSISAGYTNVAHVAEQVYSLDGVTCANSTDPACVPINLFGGFGTITPAAAAYASATAIDRQVYTQHILSSSIGGSIPGVNVPTANQPLAFSVGVEKRREKGSDTPDECLKLAPSSCLGGAGGNSLPISGGFRVSELFGEVILPLVDDMLAAKSLDLELGYRRSNYTPGGVNNTWKYGLAYAPIEPVRFRIMNQRAARAPNVGELAAPQTASLQNADLDPCSIANAANNGPGTTLRARCISTGMSAPLVGTVEDIVSNQINTFSGTDLRNLPKPEKGDSFTVGVAVTPAIPGLRSASFTLDYYKIEVQDYIGTFSPQEILDACYVGGQAAQCAKIRRVGGTLTLPGSGIETFTTNLNYLKASGLEFGMMVGVGLGPFGNLKLSGDVNQYLKQESQSSTLTPVRDCVGFYGNSCGGPTATTRWIQRTTWDLDLFEVSYLWRHIGAVSRQPDEVNNGIKQFGRINARDYLDLTGAVKVWGSLRLSATVKNVLDKDPPVVGDSAADTGSNNGNTFPSGYDTLGRVYVIGATANF